MGYVSIWLGAYTKWSLLLVKIASVSNFRLSGGPGAVRQQVIAWTSVDHVASLGHNGFICNSLGACDSVPRIFVSRYIVDVWSFHPLIGPLIWHLRPRQYGCHFADSVFKRIILNENCISREFFPRGPIASKSALVQIKAWLPEPMLINQFISPMYVSVNRVSNGSDNDLSPIRRQAII